MVTTTLENERLDQFIVRYSLNKIFLLIQVKRRTFSMRFKYELTIIQLII